MASKGGSKAQKRFATGKARLLKTKEGAWAIRSIPGAFNRENSVPLGFALRDLLKIGRTLKEVKVALNDGLVSVNGKARKDYRFPAGFFDIVSVEGMESDYRIVFDLKGRLVAKEIEKKAKKSKLCRIEDRKAAKKGRIQLVTNDGRSIFTDKGEFKVGDSVEIELPSQKLVKTLKFGKGSKVFITGGKHAGEESVIKEIKPGTMKSAGLVTLKSGSREFQTTTNNVFVVGSEKEAK